MVDIRRTDSVPEDAADRVLEILSAEAAAAGYPFRSEAASFEAREGDAFLGGLTARIGTDWVCVELLAVTPQARGRGIGRALMEAVEGWAREQGKTGIWLDSYTFQAPEFYRRLGYDEIGRIEHYPRDQARVFLAKRFAGVPLCRRLAPEDPTDAVLALIRDSFAYMEGRIDPPSSMLLLTAAAVSAQAAEGEVWLLEHAGVPVACVFLTPRDDALYIGKLAVVPAWRRRGLARRLVVLAADRARALGLGALELQTRVELVENHATFAALGFARVGMFTHPGYGRPTSIIMRKVLL